MMVAVISSSRTIISPEEIQKEKLKIWKNVGAIGFSFMLFYAAYSLVANLQSTLNCSSGLGNMSHAAIYIAQIVSCMFVPSLMISKLKLKWTMVVCQIGYIIFIAAQFWPSFLTLIPAAILIGSGGAPLWSAKSTYLTQIGVRYSALVYPKTSHNDSSESGVSRIFSVFTLIFIMSSIWGNLIGFLVLSSSTSRKRIANENISSYCGANFCYPPYHSDHADLIGWNFNTSSPSVGYYKPADSLPDRHRPSNVPLLMMILMGISFTATLILVLFVDPIPNTSKLCVKVRTNNTSARKLLIATFRQLKNPNQILLVPITLWTGFENAFWTADFTYAFINCSMGAESIAFVLIWYGLAAALTSLLFGLLVERIGRIPFFIMATSISASLLFGMQFVWQPDASDSMIFYAVAALWGTSHAIISIGLQTLYGVVFSDDKEAAFSNYRLWQSIGSALALAYANFLCVRTKLFVLMGVLFFGVIGYLAVEFLEKKRKSRKDFFKF